MKRIAALIMGFVLMTVLVAPASAKELVVAHDTNFMPFEFKGPDGKFTGFDIELWETIAKKLVKVIDTVEPEEELVAKYEERYQKFRKIYPTVKELF